MFAAKYTWLLRWALHFVQNDRAAAEDLVQETFLRMLASWGKLHSLHDPEPLLYSYLRYAYLTERRRERRYSYQSLSTVSSDTLSITLRTSTSFDQFEAQNEIRTILRFLLWRQTSARFASIFLLRFFHGFFPEEIALISMATRHSVDLSLRRARLELKAFLVEPHNFRVPGLKPMPEIPRANATVPAHALLDELKHAIFSSARGECPSTPELVRLYRSGALRSLDCTLLAHIAACEPCLNQAARLCGAPLPSTRSMDDSLRSVSRNKESTTAAYRDEALTPEAFDEGPTRWCAGRTIEPITLEAISGRVDQGAGFPNRVFEAGLSLAHILERLHAAHSHAHATATVVRPFAGSIEESHPAFSRIFTSFADNAAMSSPTSASHRD